MKIKRLSDNRRLELLPLLALLIMFAVILYTETAQRHPKIYFPPEESVPWQIFRIERIERYRPALDFLFSSESLQNIKLLSGVLDMSFFMIQVNAIPQISAIFKRLGRVATVKIDFLLNFQKKSK